MIDIIEDLKSVHAHSEYVSVYSGDVLELVNVSLPRTSKKVPPWNGVTFRILPSQEYKPWLLTLPPGSSELERIIVLKNIDKNLLILVCYKGTIAVGCLEDADSAFKVDVPACKNILYCDAVQAILCVGIFNAACIFTDNLQSIEIDYYHINYVSSEIIDGKVLEVESMDPLKGPEKLRFDLSELRSQNLDMER